MREIILNSTASQPFEIGAALVSALAYPSSGESNQRADLALAYGARWLALKQAATPALSASLADLYPLYAFHDEKHVTRVLNKSRKPFQRRMVAARMAKAFFYEARYGIQNIPPPMKRISINQLCRYVQSDCQESDPENIEKRIWRPSRPVLHIAAAIDLLRDVACPGAMAWNYNLEAMEVHKVVCQISWRHEQIMLADRRFGVTNATLLRLVWI